MKYYFVIFLLLLTSCVQSFDQWMTSSDIYNALQGEGKVGLQINFKTNSSRLDKKAIRQIREIAKALKKTDLSGKYVLVLGHTDTRGDRDANHFLSLNRAAAVVDQLIDKYGFQAEKMRWDGKGETEPLVFPERNAHDRFLNRRVEIILVKK